MKSDLEYLFGEDRGGRIRLTLVSPTDAEVAHRWPPDCAVRAAKAFFESNPCGDGGDYADATAQGVRRIK